MALTTLLFVGVLQLAFALHLRNTLIMCAAEGARTAARAGNALPDGTRRARDLVAASLGPSLATDVQAHRVSAGGVSAVAVEITAPLPLVGPFGPGGLLRVSGRAFAEDEA